MNELLERVDARIRTRGLFSPGQPILVAVSGGLDSRVLLEILARLAPQPAFSWRLSVAHFNHQLRGAASDADEAVARAAADKLNLPFFGGRGDVAALAAKQGWSIEMAARDLRHHFLAETAAAHEMPSVALAHHADDQAELFLWRLLRGAGVEGLAGMEEKNLSAFDSRVTLVRPLLSECKQDLAAFAAAEHLAFREDESNLSEAFVRNRIRRQLIPLLREYQPNLSVVLGRQMEILRAENDYLEEGLQKLIQSGAGEGFAAVPVALQRRWLLKQLYDLGVAGSFDLVETLRAEADKPVNAGGTILCRRTNGLLEKKESILDFNPSELEMALQGDQGQVLFAEMRIHWSIETSTGTRPLTPAGCELFDADKVGPLIRLRHWRAGDRFQPIGLEGEPKLQDLFTNAKLAGAKRRRSVVAVTGAGKIWWVEGLRIGERFKIDAQTRRRLRWEWETANGH